MHMQSLCPVTTKLGLEMEHEGTKSLIFNLKKDLFPLLG